MKRVFATFVADPLHSGHINILKIAKSHGFVIAGLYSDNAQRDKCDLTGSFPLLSYEERYTVLSAIKYVDKIIPCELMWRDTLLNLKPDVYVHGDDWKITLSGQDPAIWGRDKVIETMAQWGGIVVEPPYTKSISSSSIKSKI